MDDHQLANAVGDYVQLLPRAIDKDLENVITVALMTPMGNPHQENCIMGLPIIIWGLSGIGKSDRLSSISNALDLHCVPVYPGTKQPEDFSGAPWASPEGLKVECILGPARELMTLGKGTLFVDEASCATPAVQGAMLSMVLERRVGDDLLPKLVRVVLAANPPEYAAGGWGLESPFANRMAHFRVEGPNYADWVDWLIEDRKPDVLTHKNAEAMLLSSWGGYWAEVKGLLAGFMRHKKTGVLHEQPTPDNPQAGFAWPSPRSWVMGGRAKATCRCLNMPEKLEQIMLEGCVGDGAAKEFVTWEANADLPDSDHVLQYGWQIDTMRLDRTYAVFSGLVAHVLNMTDKKEQVEKGVLAWKRIEECYDAGPGDIAGRAVKQMINRGLGGYRDKNVHPSLKKASHSMLLKLGQSEIAMHAEGLQ